MADRVLRDQCEHGRYDAHRWQFNPPCPGGREVTIDYEAAETCLRDRTDDTFLTVREIIDAAIGDSDE